MIQTDWILWKLLMRNISVAELCYLLTIWMRLEQKTMWSVKCHDFQKHNISWDTMQWRCRKDDISRRTAWFARTRILQKKKNILYSWVCWSRSRDMSFGRYLWSWRLKIWYLIFADYCKYIIVREIDVKKYSETNFYKYYEILSM